MAASPSDAIAAIATPIGEGGIGVLRISGANAVSLVDTFFKPLSSKKLADSLPNTCHFGRLVAEEPIDQVVVTLFRAPHSYTGEDVVEISAHGSPFILKKILSLCTTHGARIAGPGEFTQRAFLHGKIDLTQAEAVAELIRSQTDQAHTAALSQLEGRLSWRVRGMRDALLPVMAHIEVGLDHTDDNHDFLPIDRLKAKCTELREAIDELLASARVSKVLREGLRLALVGRPNAGKSSLLNALLKEERAIVTPIAGTTRDTLEERINWDGIPVVLVDTAGVRDQTKDPIEKLGIDRTHKAIESADVVVWLLDASEPWNEEDALVEQALHGKSVLRVWNKIDLPAAEKNKSQASDLRLSAKTGEGLPGFIEAVKTAAWGSADRTLSAEWLLNARHEDALRRAREAIDHAEASAGQEAYEECVAMDLKAALDALGEIIGETSTEDLLGEVFATFCIGK